MGRGRYLRRFLIFFFLLRYVWVSAHPSPGRRKRRETWVACGLSLQSFLSLRMFVGSAAPMYSAGNFPPGVHIMSSLLLQGGLYSGEEEGVAPPVVVASALSFSTRSFIASCLALFLHRQQHAKPM